METIYITINHLDDFCMDISLRPGIQVVLQKDLNNPYDDEAIAVKGQHGEKIGYVANSVSTVARGTYSAGRLYDRIGEELTAIIRFVMEDRAIAEAKCLCKTVAGLITNTINEKAPSDF